MNERRAELTVIAIVLCVVVAAIASYAGGDGSESTATTAAPVSPGGPAGSQSERALATGANPARSPSEGPLDTGPSSARADVSPGTGQVSGPDASGSVSAAAPDQGPDPAAVDVEVETLAEGLDNVVGIAVPPDGSGRVFLLERAGRVRVWANGQLVDEPFMDITDRVVSSDRQGEERGLLGIAFHPDYPNTPEFFLNYTGNGPSGLRSVNSRFTGVDSGAPESEEQLVLYNQPYNNHNGGHLAFGPDGLLYIAVGDGGSGGDPQGNGQNRNTLLGKILRIDVDTGDPYGVPPENPFVGQPNVKEEIWAYGLRNPWRFSFDRLTGDLYIADVGQNEWEEVNFEPADSGGGLNYGWNRMEGTHCYGSPNCDSRNLVLPVAEYPHSGSGGCSVTGGYVYRGTAVAEAAGLYVYGDWCNRTIWGLSRNGDGQWRNAAVGESPFNIASFGEGEDGTIYIAGTNRFGRLSFSVAGEVATSTPTATPTVGGPETATPTVPPTVTPTGTETATNTPEPTASAGVPSRLFPVALKQ